MKTKIRNLKLGIQVWALVEECMAKNEIIVNLGGDLIRVKNESKRVLRVGERVSLRVTAIQPLQFKIVNANQTVTGRPIVLDLSI